MGWAAHYIEQLKAGNTVRFRPRGNSMQGRVEDRELVTVRPCDPAKLKVGDIVLCKVKKTEFLHLIRAIQPTKSNGVRYLIGNTRGGINGWIGADSIFGKCVNVQP